MPVLLLQEIVQGMSAQLNKKGKISLWDGKGVLYMMESKKVVNIIITSRQMDKIGNITLYNADWYIRQAGNARKKNNKLLI